MQGLSLKHLDEDRSGDVDREPAALVAAAVGAGVTLLDTAEVYGDREFIGRAVAAHRDEVLLCSTLPVYWGPSGRPGDWSVRADAATVRASCEGTLRRLSVDRIDLYYLHHRSKDTPIEETVGAATELCDRGLIRAIGLSNVTVEDLRRAQAVHPVHAVQQEYCLAHRETESLLPVLAELGIILVAQAPHAHARPPGALHCTADTPVARVLAQIAPAYDVTPGQLALAWVHSRGRRHDQPIVPLPGATRISQLLANVAAASLQIDPSDLDLLDLASTSRPVASAPASSRALPATGPSRTWKR